MIKIVFYIIYISIVVNSLYCSAQTPVQKKDSIATTQISSSFFDWYIRSAKASKQAEYNPIEVQDKNGMTTLDFSRYMENLRKYSFSDSLMKRERLSYDGCVL